MAVAERVGQLPVHLLRPRRRHVAGPQSGLDVADRHSRVERRQGRGQDGGCIALDQHAVGSGLGENAPHALEDAAGYVREVLAMGHYVQVVVRFQIEEA